MANISMCLNNRCPSRNDCWRFTAPVAKNNQSWVYFDNKTKDKCEYFVDNEETDLY